ncbi:MAG: hypothetical protein HWE22_07420 [Flavobacteriales bacterium]|nr:hypothetical protein [Flavobacteriales bacterium]
MGGEILKTGANITKQAGTVVVNATNGDIDLSSAKSIVQSSDAKINHGSYKQPEGPETQELLVAQVEGPEKVQAGKTYTYVAKSFSRKPIGGELQAVKWSYQIDDGEIQDFDNPGRIIGGIVKKVIRMPESLSDNEKIRIYAYLQGPSQDASYESEIGLVLIEVTTKADKYLFSLYPTDEHPAEKLTAKELYDKGIQWFCPHADNYLRLAETDPNLATFSELKHFTWEAIVAFAEVDRWSISFRTGGSGDWKAVATGGDGYLLITVGGYPYWADGIGQIPFSVDTYRENLEDGMSHEEATRSTLSTGQRFGDGSVIGGESDASNSYDNHIILRTCLWGESRYSVTHIQRRFLPDTYSVQTTGHSASSLGNPLSKSQVDTYL